MFGPVLARRCGFEPQLHGFGDRSITVYHTSAYRRLVPEFYHVASYTAEPCPKDRGFGRSGSSLIGHADIRLTARNLIAAHGCCAVWMIVIPNFIPGLQGPGPHGGSSRFRTCDLPVNSRTLCQLSYGTKLGGIIAAWWKMSDSNRPPPACKTGALPVELIPHDPAAGNQSNAGSIVRLFNPAT